MTTSHQPIRTRPANAEVLFQAESLRRIHGEVPATPDFKSERLALVAAARLLRVGTEE